MFLWRLEEDYEWFCCQHGSMPMHSQQTSQQATQQAPGSVTNIVGNIVTEGLSRATQASHTPMRCSQHFWVRKAADCHQVRTSLVIFLTYMLPVPKSILDDRRSQPAIDNQALWTMFEYFS
jgi:hypothetical protein